MPSRRSDKPLRHRRLSESLRKLIIFAMLGTLMFLSKLLMEAIPNVHLVGALIIIYTIVYRWEALIPIYVFVGLSGLYAGFAVWWIPYCYIWAVLWGMTMLLPKKMPRWLAAPVYMVVCALHGLAYGTLYAPFQTIAYGLDWRAMVTWIISGFPFDVIHAGSNFVAGIVIVPVSTVLLKLEQRYSKIG